MINNLSRVSLKSKILIKDLKNFLNRAKKAIIRPKNLKKRKNKTGKN